jgi:cytochrome c-type biogenesis protein
MGTFILAFLAGLISILSPCVLPLVPIVLASSYSVHKYGPAALAAGLALSFTGIGLFIATIGFSIGVGSTELRLASAVLMIFFGILLFSKSLQDKLAILLSPVGNYLEGKSQGLPGSGLFAQFGIGILLGAVWSPCVGPTLGAASILASQGKDLWQVGATMFVFGIGAALPLLVLSLLTKEAFLKIRGSLFATSLLGKKFMGATLIFLGGLIILGLDKKLEAYLVDISPEWLTTLTTRF